MTDPISDMFIRIKNAQMVKKERVSMPLSKVKLAIAEILKNQGYIKDFEKRKKKFRKSEHDYLELVLKYYQGEPALHGARNISVPSRRIYLKSKDIRPVRSGFGIALISTPKGIMSSHDARKNKVGGEIICEVW